jgi:hypothetical protein
VQEACKARAANAARRRREFLASEYSNVYYWRPKTQRGIVRRVEGAPTEHKFFWKWGISFDMVCPEADHLRCY